MTGPRACMTLLSTLAAIALVLSGCDTVPTAEDPADRVNLRIPDRAWDPNRPDLDVGWCGETCIQMAMAYYGREVSQAAINAASGSGRPDITEVDMDDALDALGVEYAAWDESNHDVGAFIEWVKDALRQGHPVICGTKIYPDEHPRWYVDHFVLATGFDERGLILNTQLDCDGKLNVSYGQLASRNNGYSFRSNQDRYFGRAIVGLR